MDRTSLEAGLVSEGAVCLARIGYFLPVEAGAADESVSVLFVIHNSEYLIEDRIELNFY